MAPSTPTEIPSAPAATQTTTAPAETDTAPQSEASKIMGLIFSLGVAAAAIFVKNPNHQQTAGNIIEVLQAELPNLQSII